MFFRTCHKDTQVSDLSCSDIFDRALLYKDCCNCKIYFKLGIVLSREWLNLRLELIVVSQWD